MAGRRTIVRAVLSVLLWSGAGRASSAHAGEDAGETGTGLLVSKGETWIGVKLEGQDEAGLYLPVWKGGLPREGGGFDKQTLALIKSLVVGSKVKLVWKTLEEHPRIISLETLALPEKKAEPPAVPEKAPRPGERPGAEAEKKKPAPSEKPVAETEKPRKPLEAEKPDKSEKPQAEASPKPSVTAGIVTAKGESYLEVRDSEATVQQFFARVLGGELGALDKDMLKQIHDLKIGEHVKIEWSLQDRRRVMSKLTSASRD